MPENLIAKIILSTLWISFTIVLFLIFNEDSPRRKIADFLKKKPATISFHLKKLNKLNCIEVISNGNQKLYRVNPDVVLELLCSYHKCLCLK